MIHLFQTNFSISDLYLFFFLQTTKMLFFCTELFCDVSEAGGKQPQDGFWSATFTSIALCQEPPQIPNLSQLPSLA